MTTLTRTAAFVLILTAGVLFADVAQAAQFTYPITGRITDTYYAKRYYGTHGALDLAGAWQCPIYPARDGDVEFAGWGNGYGWHVIINHENGYQTYYGHMALRPLVKKGDKVNRDTQLGVQGATGYAQGAHVHLEVRRNGTMQFIPGAINTYFTKGDAIPHTFADLADTDAAPQIRFGFTLDAIAGQEDDFHAEGASQGIRDVYEGQYLYYRVTIENTGTVAAQSVGLGLWHDSDWLTGLWYGVFDKNADGTWTAFEGTATASAWSFDKYEPVHIGDLAPGQTKQLLVWCFARRESVTANPDHPDLRVWLKHVDNFYEKDDFWAAPNNVNNLQKWNGGDVKAFFEVDVWERPTTARSTGLSGRYGLR